MQSDNVLVFDVGGEYGHFRKFNTTTSPLTYSIPPRTALIGMIGAILGIERETGVGKYEEGQKPLADMLAPDVADLAVQVINPTKKVTMAFNLLNTKTSFFNIDNRTQIEFELLKNPRFRVFLRWKNRDLFQQLENMLVSRHSHFTTCLGLSQFTADIAYVGTYTGQMVEASDSHVPVISAVKLSALDRAEPIKFQNEFKYVSDTFPVSMTSDRLVQEFAEIIVEATGNPIWAKSDSLYAVESLGNIQFL
jgi:CRISPR-associated protein Cas5h